MFTSVELFAGAGGFAIASEKAGCIPLLVNDIDKWATETLRLNRPDWNVINAPIEELSFADFQGCDLVTGGFPCQSFSYAGKRLGLADNRGNLFYEFLRAIKQIRPKAFIAENVKGILTHDKGATISHIMSELRSLDDYEIFEPQIMRAEYFRVPQKRHRVFIVGIRKDMKCENFRFPIEDAKITTLAMALKSGHLYDCDVPSSRGVEYSKTKKEVLQLVPPGGYWRDLPVELQKSFMGKAFHTSGGRTGIARRMSWSEPCLTLTCSPTQKQTERCHPDEIRPFTIREYARIQTFPDDWEFSGSLSNQYKQIGNAVPVNLGEAVIKSVLNTLI